MKRIDTKKALSIGLIVALLIVAYFVYAVVLNSAGEAKLKSSAPETARIAASAFDQDAVSQTEESYNCYDASRKFSPSDRYCTIGYDVSITPKKQIEENYDLYRTFFDTLSADGWELGVRSSTHYSRDTYTELSDSSQLQPDEDGIMNIAGKKKLGSGAWCNLSSQYVPPRPHHLTQDGIFGYSIDCYFEAIRFSGL